MSSTVEVPAPAESPPNVSKQPPKKSRKGIGGPKTPLGKVRSRMNSTKDGLRARIVLPDDLAQIADTRFIDLSIDLNPKGALETLLVRDMATSSAQLERAEALWMLDLQRVIDRAKVCWDADRRLAAENLGARLHQDPSRIARALFETAHGAVWLADRWHGLSALLEQNGRLTEDQRILACDLAGVPVELRDSHYRVPACDDTSGLAAVIELHLDEIDSHMKKALMPLEQAELDNVLVGMTVTEDATTARHRRYVQTHRRAFDKAFNQLMRLREQRLQVSPDVNPARPVTDANIGMHVNRSFAEPQAMIPDAVEALDAEPEVETEPLVPEIEATPEVEAPATPTAAAPAKPRNGSAERRERRARRAREKKSRKAAQKRNRKR
jgi:hypothetical protein